MVNNIMPTEFATLVQEPEGGTHAPEGAPQRQPQVMETTIRPPVQRLARAINRIFPQAQDIVVQGISEQLGYQFIPTEEETQMLRQFLTEWLQENILARQSHKSAGAVADASGGGDVIPPHP
ncbi:hypothetical protein SMACR_08539 [Sordaria macrospora]|uniref:WGS project CABT00000000 data, contig 2.59 n=2 Tax=Sordaria macrospora TaxID=5147 RepID=F7WA93_SORMK|nr:uncharacterized protein SMAC_08539 [Sordaria macrospora k-hell]KAA8635583.1 hypothetical protein SMACR_08539 [Sordaria macrospora]WPJ66328.1 hypothetical protein SMAC4_08539 [Sordaria macrospora]CCC05287.1 unnamed protein product [Sordaria macrospora k-hell]